MKLKPAIQTVAVLAGIGALGGTALAGLNITSEWTDYIEVPERTEVRAVSVPEDACVTPNPIGACPGEEGHYAAIRLVPPATPYHVQAVSYALMNESFGDYVCSAHLKHDVFLFKGPAGSPPDPNPTEIDRYTVPATSPSTSKRRWINVNPTKPIKLSAGEALFVSVQINGDLEGDDCPGKGETVCLQGCPADDPGKETWWSYDTAPAYSWSDLDTIGISYDGIASMSGFTVSFP